VRQKQWVAKLKNEKSAQKILPNITALFLVNAFRPRGEYRLSLNGF
jgi:hypothetical protein